jgi:hypothetical protein
MEQKQLNLQTVTNHGRNLNMQDQALSNIHQRTVDEIFAETFRGVPKPRDGIKRRREDMPIITKSGMEIYPKRFNNDVQLELSEIGALLGDIAEALWKHVEHNYQQELSRIVCEMQEIVSTASADFGTLVGKVEDNLDSSDCMTMNELAERRNDGDPDAAYDEYREREGENHA